MNGFLIPQHNGRRQVGRVATILWMLFAVPVSALLAVERDNAGNPASVSEYIDLLSSRRYCDTAPLYPAEGIWEYPEDGLTVLIRHRSASAGIYDVVAIDSEDTRISPGNVIGRLESTPDPRQFRMILHTKARKGVLGSPVQCLATLSAEGDALFVKSKKTKVIFNPALLLPRFWRVARIRTSDPLEKLPAGMIKVYPSYDGNGSSRHHPRYL